MDVAPDFGQAGRSMAHIQARSALAALALASGVVSFGSHARAEEATAESKAAARDLAIDGITLAQAGNCKDALPKLQRAESLYHAPTILTWVGECQIKEGRLVEGTENLNKVVREELAPGSPAAFADAKKRASALIAEASPHIGRLTLIVEPAGIEGLEITIDGKPFARALVGAPRPTDPGTHQLVVRAPGYKEASGKVEIKDAGRAELKLVLVIDPTAPASSTPPSAEPAAPEQSQGGNTQRTLGWVGVGVGGGLLITGGVTGLMAIGAKGQLSTLCPTNDTCTSEEGINKLNDANTFATISTILFGAGGVIGVTGVILLLTGSEPAPVEAKVAGATLRPVIGPTQLGVHGTF